MSNRIIRIVHPVIAAALAAFTLTARAQVGAGTVPNSVMHVSGLNVEQTGKIRDLTQQLPEMTDLMSKLAAAQQDAIQTALGKKSTDVELREKLEKVAKLQVDIAMLRYTKGIKDVDLSISNEQKNQLLEMPGFAYNQLFVGSTAGGSFQRHGRFMPDSQKK